MIWLTWRQFRVQALTALGAVAAVGLLFALSRGQLSDLAQAAGLNGCAGADACASARAEFFDGVQADRIATVLFYAGVVLLYLTPALLGLFWGAPLIAREVEAGTFRLAWSQSTTRRRWLAVKLGLVGVGSVVTGGLLSLVVTWWAGPIDRAGSLPAGSRAAGPSLPGRFAPLLFGARDLVPVGAALFAFALGVACGLLLRRTLPAMAVTLLVLTAVQVALPMTVRPHYETPLRKTIPLVASYGHDFSMRIEGGSVRMVQSVDVPGAWVISVGTTDSAGRAWNGPAPQVCLTQNATPQQCLAAVNALRLDQVVSYQPADRYWTFQWIETALYGVGAAALAGFCFVRVRGLRLD
jgi:hypothetical protein